MAPPPCRMSVSLSAPLPPFPKDGGDTEIPGMVCLVTSPRPEATQEPSESPHQNKDTPVTQKVARASGALRRTRSVPIARVRLWAGDRGGA